MIKLNDFINYFKETKERINGLKRVIFVGTESDFAESIKNMPATDFPCLVVIIPSADSAAQNDDNIKEINTSLCYVVKKIDHKNKSEEHILEVMEETQDIMEELKAQMRNDKNNHQLINGKHFMHHLKLDGWHTDPEYNYLGTWGWSLSFTIDSI